MYSTSLVIELKLKNSLAADAEQGPDTQALLQREARMDLLLPTLCSRPKPALLKETLDACSSRED